MTPDPGVRGERGCPSARRTPRPSVSSVRNPGPAWSPIRSPLPGGRPPDPRRPECPGHRARALPTGSGGGPWPDDEVTHRRPVLACPIQSMTPNRRISAPGVPGPGTPRSGRLARDRSGTLPGLLSTAAPHVMSRPPSLCTETAQPFRPVGAFPGPCARGARGRTAFPHAGHDPPGGEGRRSVSYFTVLKYSTG